MGDSPRHQSASYLSELQVVFMEAEYCHLLFISLFIFKMGLVQLAKTLGHPCIIYEAALTGWSDGLIAVRAEQPSEVSSLRLSVDQPHCMGYAGSGSRWEMPRA